MSVQREHQPNRPPARNAHAVDHLCSHIVYRVPFYDTDAMGVVHHANYLRYLELLRVHFMEQHDEAYERYVAAGLNIVVTRVSIEYKKPCIFNDDISITGRLEWLKALSFGFSYVLMVEGKIVVTAATEHAMVGSDGKLKRIPAATRQRLSRLVVEPRVP